MPLAPRTVELPPLCRRAAVQASTIDDENRTVELTFTTGAAVRRTDWWTGKSYIEKLSLDPKHVRLERLNSGAPLLNSHSAYSVEDQIGVVEDGSARIVGKKGVATVRFSSRDSVAPIWRDVKEKVIRNVSVGYYIHRFEESAAKDGEIPTRLATDWEPYEISMVPMPADAGAQTRDGKPVGATCPCEIVIRGDQAESAPQETTMDERETSDTLIERDPGQPSRLALDPPPAPTDAEVATRAERDRVEGINHAARSARITSEHLDKLIKEGTPLAEAQRQCLEVVRTRGGDDRAPRQLPSPDVRLGDDPLLHVRAGIENALQHRAAPKHFELTEQGRNYRAMSILDTAEVFLKHHGKRTTSMTRMQIVTDALNLRGGYHTTSDFAEILGNVVKSVLKAAYGEEPQTFLPISRRVTATDFRQMKLVQTGDAPDLEKVLEHGEFTRGTIGESKETMQLETYGRVFAITRQALVNDDLDAFATLPAMFGRSARKKESDIVWATITGNPVMGDGNALFSAAHANLQTDGDVISIASMSRARLAMRLQTGINGSRINLVPRILIVPPSLETVAEQFLAPVLAAQTNAAQNPFAGKFQVIVESRLEDDSATAWYIATSADQLPVIYYAYLDGQEGVSIDTRSGFDIDGLEVRARLDFDAAPVDYRGIHKDPGELAS